VHEVKELQARMVEQIISSVRWVACVEFLVSAGVLNCVECGPGKVLAGLIKRIDKNLAVRNIGQLGDLDG
jgi:[acyl-carrier-protein] S-malonyltransferase